MRHHIPLSIITTILLASCGGGGSSTPTTSNIEENLTTVANEDDNKTALRKGYLIDSPISGASYSCGDIVNITNKDGEFACRVAPVEFSVGGLKLGTLNSFTTDGKVYPQDLLNLKRDNFEDENLTKLLQIMQSLDDDGNITDRINITQDMRDKLKDVNDLNITVNIEEAVNHLKKSMGIVVVASIEQNITTPIIEEPKENDKQDDEAEAIVSKEPIKEEEPIVITYIALNSNFPNQNSSITYQNSQNYTPSDVNITSGDAGGFETEYSLNNQPYYSGDVASLNIGDNNLTATTTELGGNNETQTVWKNINVQDPNYINANFDINTSDYNTTSDGNITLEKGGQFTIPTPENVTGDGDFNISAVLDGKSVEFGQVLDLNETKDMNLTYTLNEPNSEEGISDGQSVSKTHILRVLDTTPPEAPVISQTDSTTSSTKSVRFTGEAGSTMWIDGDERGLIGDFGYGNAQVNLPSYGTHNFSGLLVDKSGNPSDSVDFSIVRTQPNYAPHAGLDVSEVAQGGSVLIDVLANDTDANGDSLSIIGTPTVSVGTIAIESNKLRYTAPTSGDDTVAVFNYEVSDGRGGVDEGLGNVSIDVPTDFSGVIIEDPGVELILQGTISDANGIKTVDISFDDGEPNSHYEGGCSFENEGGHPDGTNATIVVVDNNDKSTTKIVTLN